MSAAGPTSAVAAGAVNFLQPPSGGGGGGGGGGAGPGGGAGGSGVGGSNITLVRSRRVVQNNQNAGTDLNSAMNSSSTIVFTRPPSSTQSASLIPRSSPPIVTPIAFTSPARLTSSAPLQQESVHFSSPEPSRRMTSRGTPSRWDSPAPPKVTPATATELPPRPRMSTPEGLTPFGQASIDQELARAATNRQRIEGRTTAGIGSSLARLERSFYDPQQERRRYDYNPQMQIRLRSNQTNVALVEALRAGRELEAQDKESSRSRSQSSSSRSRSRSKR